MEYLPVVVSVTLSIAAYAFWSRLAFSIWSRRTAGQDLAEVQSAELPSVIIMVFPRRFRVWLNWAMFWAFTLMLGIPHVLVLRMLIIDPGSNPWIAAHYLWTLGLWLSALFFPAFVLAGHKTYVRLKAGAEGTAAHVP